MVPENCEPIVTSCDIQKLTRRQGFGAGGKIFCNSIDNSADGLYSLRFDGFIPVLMERPGERFIGLWEWTGQGRGRQFRFRGRAAAAILNTKTLFWLYAPRTPITGLPSAP